MNVIGLDLSLTAPGMATPAFGMDTLRTDPRRGDKRFCDIRDWLEYAVAVAQPAMRPHLAMIEAVPPYDHASSGLERVHGVAREVLARHDVPFTYVNVTALKSFATGNGRADKASVMAYVAERTGRMPDDDNQADAFVLRDMGEMFASDWPALGGPFVQPMSGVQWPLRPNDPGWPQPYGPLRTKPITKKCRHGAVCLKNGDHWLHPFDVVRCDKPPK